MDSQHGPNPWSIQQLQVKLPAHSYPNDSILNDNSYANQPSSKNDDNDSSSFDSTATTPHTHYDTHSNNIFYGVFPLSEQESDTNAQDYSTKFDGHIRTWSYQDTLTNSNHGDDDSDDADDENGNESDKAEGDDEAPVTINSSIDNERQLVLLSSSKTDASTVLESGDMLEHLVQRLQSEVADTRAIVHDLESRLNAAENSNKHIVQELKVLLADAEGTLVGSDDSDSEDLVLAHSKSGSASEEDSNVVYNRICHALQTLIAEAQSALMRSSSLSPSTEKLQVGTNCRHQHPQYQHTSIANHSGPYVVDDSEHAPFEQSCRTSRRGSSSHGRIDKTLLYPSPPSTTSNGSSRSVYSTSSELSRILWKEKQQEQYDRYRRSCDMVSLELQLLLNDSAFNSDDDQFDANFFVPEPHHPTKTNTSNNSSKSSDTTISAGAPLTEATAPATSSLRRSALFPHQRENRDGELVESRAEKLQRRYQVQFLNPNNVQERQHMRPCLQNSVAMYIGSTTVTAAATYTHRPIRRPTRHFKNQGVGASRSQSIFMQLYALWKNTWLRKRMMHVLTSTVELLVILTVIVKLSQVSLSWMGVSLDKGQDLLTAIYGHRHGTAGQAAKELYEKIRRDGLRLRQIRLRQLYPETEALVQDLFLGGGGGGPTGQTKKIPTPFTPSGMVYTPAKRMLSHIVAGAILSYVAEHAKHIAMKL